MIEIILSHWATYLLLFWLAVIAIANLWPSRKPAGASKPVRFSPRRAERAPAAQREDELELARPQR
jgi:hypothetical protein